MSRLLRLMTRYAAASPSLWGGHVRDSSPPPGSSTLMTSAPRSARRAPHHGPAMTRERSMTRMPSRARGKVVMGGTIPRPVLHSSRPEIFLDRGDVATRMLQRKGEVDEASMDVDDDGGARVRERSG